LRLSAAVVYIGRGTDAGRMARVISDAAVQKAVLVMQ